MNTYLVKTIRTYFHTQKLKSKHLFVDKYITRLIKK